ncbi:DUF418 domain-containing protein [Bacillus toyonensis]|uniref:DUF418 domain-containing protein n=1 Tax=Bacillus toyonensis TaxID=155322 RepID=UPI003D24007B
MTIEKHKNRIEILDYLRGFALIGILLVNILFLLKIDSPSPNSFDASYQRFLYLFVEGRFYTIFSFLFGVGFYIFITRAQEKHSNAYVLFIRRLVILAVMGCIHLMFNHDEALTLYAIFGIFLLPFYKVKKQINLILALLGVFYVSFLGLKLPFPYFLLGLTAGQYRIFENISENKSKYTIIAFVLSMVGLWFQYMHLPLKPFNLMKETADDVRPFIKLGITIGPIISACYIGLLILLLQWAWVQKLLSPLKYYGRMALTNYISQTALVLIFGYYLQLIGDISYSQSLFLCIGIYVLQLLFSMMWLRFFRMGPLEWIWRICTYWKLIPIKK